MCTAATYLAEKGFYFGRTLDYEFSYGERICVVPRNFAIGLRHEQALEKHYAIIGMATIEDDYPLFYDGVNECGLAMAGLNFVKNACYSGGEAEGKTNVAVFEFIPYLLGKCANITEAKKELESLNLIGESFSEKLPCAQLHWLISDRSGSITVECTKNGMDVYDNPVGVLANNPPFPQMMNAISDCANLSPKQPESVFDGKAPFSSYSRGMGGIGLPGDLSSKSRFVRAAFVKLNSKSGGEKLSEISQFFHILGSVDQQRGCCEVKENEYEITIYTGCCDCDTGVYYYTGYDNHQINAVDMHRENLDASELKVFTPIFTEQINYIN